MDYTEERPALLFIKLNGIDRIVWVFIKIASLYSIPNGCKEFQVSIISHFSNIRIKGALRYEEIIFFYLVHQLPLGPSGFPFIGKTCVDDLITMVRIVSGRHFLKR